MKQFKFEESMGFMIAQLCKHHRSKASDLLSEIGLYTGQEMILTYLNNKGPITQNALVKSQGVKPSTITKGLQRLEKAGFINRKKDKTDGRVMNISLTKAGNEIQQPIQKTWSVLEDLTLRSFTTEEKIILRRLLSQIVSNIKTS